MTKQANLPREIRTYYKITRNCVLTPVILATWEVEIERISSSGPAWANSWKDSISKITTAKNRQVVQYLLCKCEAPSSNPSPTKK
jgi:hypothetical protein